MGALEELRRHRHRQRLRIGRPEEGGHRVGAEGVDEDERGRGGYSGKGERENDAEKHADRIGAEIAGRVDQIARNRDDHRDDDQ